jgi:AcrR family transcriptional regulator
VTPRPFAEASRELLRDTVLRATHDLLAARDWSAVTVGQVASAAGVSRQTVYNEFGNRADLALAYASWAGDQLLDEVERCVADHADDLVEALVAAFAVFLDLGHGHPLIRAIASPAGADDLLTTLSGPRHSPIVERATARLAGIILRTWPGLPAEPVGATSELLVRVAISHLLLPTGSPEGAARHVSVVVGPLLRELAAELPG